MKALSIIAVLSICLCGWPRATFATSMAVINEVLYDGPGADADDVFTELFGTPGLALNGWSLTGTNGADGAVYRTVSLTGSVIPADGIFLIASLYTLLGGVDLYANVDWQNGPDSIQLRDPSGLIVDALQYGDAGVFNSGEGAPAPDTGAGQSLSRDQFGTDTNDNLTDFTALTSPTPGAGPRVTQVPEPATIWLLSAGLFYLFLPSRPWIRRRWLSQLKKFAGYWPSAL